jgi:hypothetical protein
MRARRFLAVTLVFAFGCAGSVKLAPVSGKVTMDGKPLVGATVSFTPIDEKDKKGIEAPLSSIGNTNDQGEFTLQTTTGQPGAVVGKHKVSISLLKEQAGDTDDRPPRGGWPTADLVPLRYNEKTELTFDVPAGGTKEASFPLTSKK